MTPSEVWAHEKASHEDYLTIQINLNHLENCSCSVSKVIRWAWRYCLTDSKNLLYSVSNEIFTLRKVSKKRKAGSQKKGWTIFPSRSTKLIKYQQKIKYN